MLLGYVAEKNCGQPTSKVFNKIHSGVFLVCLFLLVFHYFLLLISVYTGVLTSRMALMVNYVVG